MNVMILVSHVDDNVLGCGGYIAQLTKEGHKVSVVYLTDGLPHPPKKYDNREDTYEANKLLGVDRDSVHFIGLKNQRFDEYTLIDINKKIDALNIDPDLLITNSPTDVNYDHHITFRCATVIGRSISKQIDILSCEILSSSEWGCAPFNANYYVDIEKTLDLKIDAMKVLKNEMRTFPHPRSVEGIVCKARQRGMEVGWEAAEAYNIVRMFKR